MKKIPILLTLLALTCLGACRPAPKPTAPPATASPTTETAAAAATPAAGAPTERPPEPAAAITPTNLSITTPPPAPLLSPAEPATDNAAISAPEVATPPLAPRNEPLRILAPEGQISDNVKQLLATKSRQDLQIDTYSTNDEAVEKLSAAAPSPVYALALLSYRIVPYLIGTRALATIPTLPLSQQPAPKYLHHFFDRDNKYSLPYAFSVAGIAARATDVKATPSQWSELFNQAMPNTSIRLPGDSAIAACLLAKAGVPNSSPSGLTTSAAAVASIHVDSIASLKKQFAAQPGWRLVLPAEGSVIYLHCVTIPANSPAPDKSPALLAIFLDPEILARIGEENYLGITQAAAMKYLPPASIADALIYPPERILDKCVFVREGYRTSGARARASSTPPRE